MASALFDKQAAGAMARVSSCNNARRLSHSLSKGNRSRSCVLLRPSEPRWRHRIGRTRLSRDSISEIDKDGEYDVRATASPPADAPLKATVKP